MREITLEQLLEAGCHFGHQVTRSNPKARDFIYEARDNIHIIDLAKTKQYLEEAGAFVKSIAEKKGTSIIVIGTKRQARGIVQEAMSKAKEEGAIDGLFYIVNRWVGGLLTNFAEVSKNFKKLKELSENLQSEDFRAKYTKKEIGLFAKEKEKLESLYGGVVEVSRKPDALFIIDSHLEELAVREAMQTGVSTVAIVDTNADPDIIDYPIPANDDAVGSIKLITNYIIDAWIEGRNLLEQRQTHEKRESELAKDTKGELAKNVKKEKITKDAKAKKVASRKTRKKVS